MEHDTTVASDRCPACVDFYAHAGWYPTLSHYLSALPEPERTARRAEVDARYAGPNHERTTD